MHFWKDAPRESYFFGVYRENGPQPCNHSQTEYSTGCVNAQKFYLGRSSGTLARYMRRRTVRYDRHPPAFTLLTE